MILKSNKYLLIPLLLLMVAPFLSVGALQTDFNTIYSSQDVDSDVLVVPGQTLKYTIDDLTFPDMETTTGMPSFTLPDLSGNEIYVKVLGIHEDVTLDLFENIQGTLVDFAMGLLLTQDVSLEIGEGATAISMILPEGAATPAIVQQGVPHFNNTELLYGPSIFFLNDDWTEHQNILELYGFTVTNGADEFSVELTTTNSTISMTYRKSDGILTDLTLDNAMFGTLDLTDALLSISLASVEEKGLNLTVGQEITLNADTMDMDISGSGDIYSQMESDVTSMQNEMNQLEGNDVVKFHIDEINGLYYTATMYEYDMDTQSLVESGQQTFCGFLGAISTGGMYVTGYSTNMVAEATYGAAPAITPDWDIYEGYMLLADTIIGVYLDDLLNLAGSEMSSAGINIKSISAELAMTTEGDYHMMTADLSLEFEASIDAAMMMGGYTAQETPAMTIDIDASIAAESWVAYSNSGILSGMRVQLDADATIETTMATSFDETTPGVPTGTVSIDMDMKMLNPDENPPDPIGGGSGVIPGFTWIIVIPAIAGIAAFSFIIQKKRN
jgi:hypothetical protein